MCCLAMHFHFVKGIQSQFQIIVRNMPTYHINQTPRYFRLFWFHHILNNTFQFMLELKVSNWYLSYSLSQIRRNEFWCFQPFCYAFPFWLLAHIIQVRSQLPLFVFEKRSPTVNWTMMQMTWLRQYLNYSINS